MIEYQIWSDGVHIITKGTMNEAITSALTNASFTDFDNGKGTSGLPGECILGVWRVPVGGNMVDHGTCIMLINREGFRPHPVQEGGR